uniref:Uncharacterized protein n=1 Tax=Picea glauca TaxID=3330 RepID=A0A101LUR8_PICGL|nr:hypothetical protein ABT39_MTgene2298 [Picea glauca]
MKYAISRNKKPCNLLHSRNEPPLLLWREYTISKLVFILLYACKRASSPPLLKHPGRQAYL